MPGGKITLWTYGKAQKTRNIGRDARVTCLIEAGEDYSELRGVLIYGTARLIDDRKGVFDVGMGITRRMAGMTSPEDPVGAPEIDDADPFREYVEQTARKRVAFVVEPTRMVSWDHRKLAH